LLWFGKMEAAKMTAAQRQLRQQEGVRKEARTARSRHIRSTLAHMARLK